MKQFGTVPLSEVTTERILQAIEELRTEEERIGTRAGSTVDYYLRFLRRVTAQGKVLTYLPVDPVWAFPRQWDMEDVTIHDLRCNCAAI